MRLHEIFTSLQGEGRNTGRLCLFIRLAGCNLKCPWCDTPHVEGQALTISELMARITPELQAMFSPSVIITGGEPTLQPDFPELVAALKAQGCWVAIETNATQPLDPQTLKTLDYIAASPKLDPASTIRLQSAHEVRLVVTDATTAAQCVAVRNALPAREYYLSPCFNGSEMCLLPALKLLGELNATLATAIPWRLSLQTHKLANIP